MTTKLSSVMLKDLPGITEEFASKAEAILASPVSEFIRIFGINTFGDYGGIDALYSYTAVVPPHDHYITCANGRKYVRVPPATGVPCSVCEIGLLPNRGIGVDCTPDLNKVYLAADNSNCKHWRFPDTYEGVTGTEYYFKSLPNNMPRMTLEGPGQTDTMSCFKSFVSTHPRQGIFNVAVSGTFLKGIRCVGVVGSQNPAAGNVGTGCGVSIVSEVATGLIGYSKVEDIEVTSDSTLPNGHACLDWGMYIDGSLNSIPGIRAIPMINLKLFGAEQGAFHMKTHVGGLITMNGTYGAGGLSGRAVFTGAVGKTGDGTVLMSGEFLGGLGIDFQAGFTSMTGIIGGPLDIGANCSGVMILGTTAFCTSVTNLGPASCKIVDVLI